MTDTTTPAPSRLHRALERAQAAPRAALDTTIDVGQTLAEFERLAIETGAVVRIEPVEFWSGLSIDNWSPVWLGDGMPAAARVTVWRDATPTQVYRRWVEALPAEGVMTEDGREWRELWAEKPMLRFESYVIRAALARAFRDAIGDRREPGEAHAAPAAPTVAAIVPPVEAAAIIDPVRPGMVVRPMPYVPSELRRPVPTPTPRPEVPEKRDTDRPRPRPQRETAISRALQEAEQASGKTVSRKAKSRGQRDSGRRGGGRS
ncbi:hypothetical protein [Microbacterium arborescens]